MSGLHAIIVGYRYNDRRRWLIEEQARQVARCVSCSQPVWFSKSGQDAYRTRDPKVVCQDCFDIDGDQIKKEL